MSPPSNLAAATKATAQRDPAAAAPAAPAAQAAEARAWTIDPSHSALLFAVRHTLIATVTGRFKVLGGTIRFDPSRPSAASVEAEVDVASVDTLEPMRDHDLRGAGFLDAGNHPRASFRSLRVEARGPDEATVVGELTLRGVTREVAFEVQRVGEGLDGAGQLRMGLDATATIRRTDFGIGTLELTNAGALVVSDAVKLTLHLEAAAA